MFSKGSRYRNLSEFVFLTAEGERIRSKVLRVIPSRESNVLHTVKSGDRLDLLAYQYYGDTTKWWQISDANPHWPFPIDLLGTTPMVEERFSLTHADFEVRYDRLITALENIGTVGNDLISYFTVDEPFESQEIVKPNFLDVKVLVKYPPAKRALVLAAIQTQNFHRLSSFSFEQETDLVEVFTIDDPEVKRGWDLLVANLRQTPGVVTVESSLSDGLLTLVYNTAMVSRESLLGLINQQGFIVDVTPISRAGKKIHIPPNQVA
jgi:hypothetical protein